MELFRFMGGKGLKRAIMWGSRREWMYVDSPSVQLWQIRSCMCECAPSVHVTANELRVKCFTFHAGSGLSALKIHLGSAMFQVCVVLFPFRLDDHSYLERVTSTLLLLVPHCDLYNKATCIWFLKRNIFRCVGGKNTLWRDKTCNITKRNTIHKYKVYCGSCIILSSDLTLLHRYYNEWKCCLYVYNKFHGHSC